MAGNAGRKIYLPFFEVDRAHWARWYALSTGIARLFIYFDLS